MRKLVVAGASITGAIALTQWLQNAGFGQDALAFVWISCVLIIVLEYIGIERLRANLITSLSVGVLIVGGFGYLAWRAYVNRTQPSTEKSARTQKPLPRPLVDELTDADLVAFPRLPDGMLLPVAIDVTTGSHELRNVSFVCSFQSVKVRSTGGGLTHVLTHDVSTYPLPVPPHSRLLLNCGTELLLLHLNYPLNDLAEAVMDIDVEASAPGIVGSHMFHREFRLQRNLIQQLVWIVTEIS